MIAREQREYDLADEIVVLSHFARKSFLEQGLTPEKVRLLPLGANLERFRPSELKVRERAERIRRGDPIRVLYVGSLSLRKGLWDLQRIVESVEPGRFRFTAIGGELAESRLVRKRLRGLVKFVSHQPYEDLPAWYTDNDIFLFPTIEDGFAVVLAEAETAGLAILATENCAAPDFVAEGVNGWVTPIRRPERFVEVLNWCHNNRGEFATMLERRCGGSRRDWIAVAKDFEAIAEPQHIQKPLIRRIVRTGLKIAIAVHGRFHAFHLARALIQMGEDVKLLTNCPKWATRKFGLPDEHVVSYWPHGVLTRATGMTVDRWTRGGSERWTHPLFGRWVLEEARRLRCDVVHTFSGVAEEVLREKQTLCRLGQIVRGSVHIRYQDQLLREEEGRTGVELDRPSAWMVEREEREYELADRIVVLSQFAYQSFLSRGIHPDKVRVVASGVRFDQFTPSRSALENRIKRIESGAPLNVLFVGNLSFQKGLHDYVEVVKALHDGPFRFSIVGNITEEANSLFASVSAYVKLTTRVFEGRLPELYAEQDVFLFPTIQDGYPAVLAQATANGMPVITTPNGSGPDIITNGVTGWIVPIRSPTLLIEKLVWCHENRSALAAMAFVAARETRVRSWDATAAEFLGCCQEGLSVRESLRPTL
jgi:glycosyltransferase involved in cell wall biosynthesis